MLVRFAEVIKVCGYPHFPASQSVKLLSFVEEVGLFTIIVKVVSLGEFSDYVAEKSLVTPDSSTNIVIVEWVAVDDKLLFIR